MNFSMILRFTFYEDSSQDFVIAFFQASLAGSQSRVPVVAASKRHCPVQSN
jgi:hypothetical protein